MSATKPTSQPPPYPTADQVSAIFAKCSTDEEIANLRHLFAPDCDGHVTGQDHHLGGSRSTGEEWVLHLETMNAIYDKSTFEVEIVHVFGGGESPWVCMEAVVSAKTLEGKRKEFLTFEFTVSSFSSSRPCLFPPFVELFFGLFLGGRRVFGREEWEGHISPVRS